MGVKGLWRLVSSCGTPVPLESLENKILAVDVSIWLHQAVRGFKGFGSGSVANVHLLTLFHRICKLLFYRIHPVFVFDGGVPQLKRQTLSSRRLKREAAASKAQKVRERLLSNLLRSQAVRKALGKKGPAPNVHHISKPVKKEKDLFELPPLNKPLNFKDTKASSTVLESDSDEEEEDYILKNLKQRNLHDFEYENNEFKSLPLEMQHEVLSELQPTRKENSWHTVNEMPQESNTFSSFQMDRLLKRYKFQRTLENVQSEIQKQHTAEIEAQLFGELEKHVSQTHRIVSEDSAHSILIKHLTEENNASSGTLNETILEEKKKVGKKSVVKQDFLTELAKQGIVKPTSNEGRKRDFDSSFSESEDDYDDSLSEDEMYIPRKKRKIEEAAFLRVIDYVLDDNELTQEEILSVIKQTQVELKNESSFGGKMHNSNTALDIGETGELHKPSTSMNAPGMVYNSDAESSSDNDDFIDVTDFESSGSNEPSNKFSQVSTPSDQVSPYKNKPNLEISGNNVDKILGTKTDSLYIKILQQKLDDIVQKSQASTVKSTIDTRKTVRESSLKNNSGLASEKRSVMIDLDLIRKPTRSVDDDIFKDIFSKEKYAKISKDLDVNVKSPNANIKVGSAQKTEICTHVVTTLPENKNKYVESKLPTSDSDLIDMNVADQLKEKVSELLKTEVTKIINDASNSTSCNKTEKTLNVVATAKSGPLLDMKPKTNLRGSENRAITEKNSTNDSRPENHKINNSENETNHKGTLYIIEDKDVDFSETAMKKDMIVPELQIQSKNMAGNMLRGEKVYSLEMAHTEDLKSSDTTFLYSETSERDDVNLHKIDEFEKVPNENGGTPVLHETPLKYSVDELKDMETELTNEQNSLITEALTVERVAVELSDQVYGEAQELLKTFGLPYLVAPMEAESQCAFFDRAGLTHGTITDDSDIFLFGGKKVYKNFFNQSKHVECFKVDSIQYNMGLDRNKMIALAMLTGSDYAVGIESVGAVLGMEVLSEFPGNGLECLKNLKKWWNVASKTMSSIHASKTKQRLSLLHLPELFPSENIFKAYLNPQVDESEEKFSWGIPDVEKLRSFATEKFGWNQSKTDEIIIPVFKKLGIKETQMRIDSYFTNIKLVKEPHSKSKRLKDAIARAKGGDAETGSTIQNNLSMSDKATSKSNRNPKRTLLMDPSEGNYGSTKKRKQGRKKKVTNTIEKRGEKKSDAISDEMDTELYEEMDDVPEIPLSKEEKKSLIFKRLLEKEEIMQSEKDKKEKMKKKAQAALVLAKGNKGGKTKNG